MRIFWSLKYDKKNGKKSLPQLGYKGEGKVMVIMVNPKTGLLVPPPSFSKNDEYPEDFVKKNGLITREQYAQEHQLQKV